VVSRQNVVRGYDLKVGPTECNAPLANHETTVLAADHTPRYMFFMFCRTQLARQVHGFWFVKGHGFLRVEFFLKTDSGYPRDAEVTLFTLANPESSLRFNTHWSAPPVSTLAFVSFCVREKKEPFVEVGGIFFSRGHR